VHAHITHTCEAAQLLAHANRRACLAEQGSLGPKKRRRETPERVPVRRRVRLSTRQRTVMIRRRVRPSTRQQTVKRSAHTDTQAPIHPVAQRRRTGTHGRTDSPKAHGLNIRHQARLPSRPVHKRTGAKAYTGEQTPTCTPRHTETGAQQSHRLPTASNTLKSGINRRDTRETDAHKHPGAQAYRHTGAQPTGTPAHTITGRSCSQGSRKQRVRSLHLSASKIKEQRSPRLPRGSFWDS
jgi:hypothetical protein